jgi:UDP-2-acetamido-3-amino-2,3-dideoxy-glucuronate N-acetyltransferase
MNKKFIAHIGLGYWGKNILRNLYELNVLKIACDSSEDTITERKKQFPEVEYTTKIEDIISNPEIKAVTIATPAETHYELAKKFLLSGKDVFVEKPIALAVKEGEELVEIAEKQGRILMVGHILQYHPAVIKLKELISSGSLGKIKYIYSNRLNIGKIRTEENILWSFAPHDISIILDLVGDELVEVSAFAGNYLMPKIYDIAIITLKFKNEIRAHIFVSWLHPFKEQRLVIIGSKAMVVFDDVSQEKLFFYPHNIEWKDGKIPIAQKADFEVIPIENQEPLKLELLHFIDCVKNRKRPKTDGYEGIKVLKVLEYAEKALMKNNLKVAEKKEKDYYVHETAIIDEGVKIGEGTKIWHFTHILKGSKIGENCIIGQNVMIGPDVTIGNKCKIQNNVSLFKGVVLEDEVFCGPSCVFTNVLTPRAFIERKNEFKQTLVKKGATIGANATILCGITIGKYAMIGAGAVLTQDAPDYALFYGNPARHMGWVCKCGIILVSNGEVRGEKLENNKIVCKNCGSIYFYKNKQFYPIKEKI